MKGLPKGPSLIIFASPDGGHLSRIAAELLATAAKALPQDRQAIPLPPSAHSALDAAMLAAISPAEKPSGGAVVELWRNESVIVCIQAVGRYGPMLRRLTEGAAREVFEFGGRVFFVDLGRYHGRLTWLSSLWDRLFPWWRLPGLWLGAYALNRLLEELRQEIQLLGVAEEARHGDQYPGPA